MEPRWNQRGEGKINKRKRGFSKSTGAKARRRGMQVNENDVK